jgi:CheY-like chemotaxis protein
VARVLIVDDSRLERFILGKIIEHAGHECDFASGGREALEIYLRGGTDVVVTDLEMPDGGGLELIEALRSLLPEPAIIVVSGMRLEVLAEARSKGAFVAFSKPVDPHELLEAIAANAGSGS